MWLKRGNHKLDKGVAVWNIPANKEVCGRVCEGCYAIKAQNGRHANAVNKAREMRLEFSLGDDFVETISKELSRSRSVNYVRIHESGEFYSQDYVDKWVAIAKAVPHLIFFAFTKREKHFDMSELKKLPNVIIIDSLKFGGLNYGSLEKMGALAKKTGAMLCPYHKKEVICGLTCTYCMTKEAQEKGVLFAIH